MVNNLCLYTVHAWCRKTCSKLNEITKNEIKSIIVGTHASALPKKTLQEEPYTYVCQGEGPITVENLIKYIDGSLKDIKQIPGLWYYDNDKNISSNAPAKMFEDLDINLPGQAWDLLDMSKYKAHNWHTFGNLKQEIITLHYKLVLDVL